MAETIQTGMASFLLTQPVATSSKSAATSKKASSSSFQCPAAKPKGLVQKKIYNDLRNPEISGKMDAANSDWIHSTNQPFNTAEDDKFKFFLNLARHLPVNYVPPHNSVGGPLLDANYKNTMESAITKLKTGAVTFGLTFFGDGATIQRNPKMNLLASGVHEPAAVIDVIVIDCSGHMSLGGKKDASYIANLFLPWFRKVYPRHELIDLVYFDGASNLQEAGEVLSKFYPRVTCLHGAEHVVSLFFNDIFAMEPFHMLFNFHNKVSQLFVITYVSGNTSSYVCFVYMFPFVPGLNDLSGSEACPNGNFCS